MVFLFVHRLTVVVVKARNLRPESDENENRHDALSEIQNVFVKVNFASNLSFQLRATHSRLKA